MRPRAKSSSLSSSGSSLRHQSLFEVPFRNCGNPRELIPQMPAGSVKCPAGLVQDMMRLLADFARRERPRSGSSNHIKPTPAAQQPAAVSVVDNAPDECSSPRNADTAFRPRCRSSSSADCVSSITRETRFLHQMQFRQRPRGVSSQLPSAGGLRRSPCSPPRPRHALPALVPRSRAPRYAVALPNASSAMDLR